MRMMLGLSAENAVAARERKPQRVAKVVFMMRERNGDRVMGIYREEVERRRRRGAQFF